MRTIKLDVNDSIFDKVMLFLNNFSKHDVQKNIEEKRITNKLNAISIKTKDFKFNRDEAINR
ncbi:MAG: hypothetical protein PF693_01075 [Spirochaetia bacterium]|nr:hypothetical protein [Spirochaetia bacterium]